MKRAWEFLAAWWHHTAADAEYPSSPGGQVPTLQADGTVKWETGGGASSSGHWSPLVNGDPDSPELVFDADGDVIMVWVEEA